MVISLDEWLAQWAHDETTISCRKIHTFFFCQNIILHTFYSIVCTRSFARHRTSHVHLASAKWKFFFFFFFFFIFFCIGDRDACECIRHDQADKCVRFTCFLSFCCRLLLASTRQKTTYWKSTSTKKARKEAKWNVATTIDKSFQIATHRREKRVKNDRNSNQ